MSIASKEAVVAIAQGVIERAQAIDDLAKKIDAEDMRGLECAETVQIDKLTELNAHAARLLADWIIKEHGPAVLADWMLSKEHCS